MYRVVTKGPEKASSGSDSPYTAPLIDPRVAKHGGTRGTNPKDTYDFPGMQDDTTWRRSRVHRFTAYYGCHRCGHKFTGLHAVYVHLAKRHGVRRQMD